MSHQDGPQFKLPGLLIREGNLDTGGIRGLGAQGRPREVAARRRASAGPEERPQKKPALLTPCSGTFSFQNCENMHFRGFNCPVCGILQWQPWQPDTEDFLKKMFVLFFWSNEDRNNDYESRQSSSFWLIMLGIEPPGWLTATEKAMCLNWEA